VSTEVPKPTVLYLDDQPGNLTVFRANFRRHAKVVTTTDPQEALRLLDENEFSLVISDQRMDAMSGSEFLAEVRKRHPDTIRMLLTAFSDFDAVVSAINDGEIARFIRKPWEREDLLATIIAANELYWSRRENKLLTDKLLHRERLAAIGQVTAGLVHELGNMTNKLSVATEIQEFWGTGEDMTREFQILKSGITGIQVLLETLRIYSKGGGELEPRPQLLELGEMLSTWMTMLKMFPHVRDLATLTYDPNPQELPVRIDPKMIEQVIVNLVKNGAEAAGEGGNVRLSTEAGDGVVHIHIDDDGPGIPPEVGAKVWEAFYSTKGDHGTGLGLMMCKRIMAAHEGELGFVNRAEGGCRFTITLPLTPIA
jgi:signal transduction histidine kinase